MFDVAESLQGGLSAASRDLQRAQIRLVRSDAAGGSAESQSAMADAARAALFDEALLSAVRSRLAELKAVAK